MMAIRARRELTECKVMLWPFRRVVWHGNVADTSGSSGARSVDTYRRPGDTSKR